MGSVGLHVRPGMTGMVVDGIKDLDTLGISN